MTQQTTERFLNELSVRVFSGDWRGYRDMVVDGMVNVGDARSVVHLGDDMHRRALASLSLRVRATGWDGLKVRVIRCTAFGRDLELVETLSTPMSGDKPAAAPFAEAYLLRHGEDGMRVIALLNPTSERFWNNGVRRDALPARAEAAEAAEAIFRTVTAMHQAVQDKNLGAFLPWVDLPLTCFFPRDEAHCLDADGIRDMLRRLQHMSSMLASHTVKIVDMARFGDALIAARFEVHTTLHDGQRRDPYHNLYFLRQGPDGWRVALVASAAIGRLLPPEGASEPQSAASPHGMNLPHGMNPKDD
jgi:hypothetical protein